MSTTAAWGLVVEEIKRYDATIMMRGSPIDDKGCRQIGKVLRVNTTVLCLALSECGITGRGGKLLLDSAFTQNSSLVSLDLSWNDMDSALSRSISRIRDNKTLLHLNLQGNRIGTSGAIALAQMLKENKFLRHLNIGSNRIGMEGTIAIAESLGQNDTLQGLMIHDNAVGSNTIAFANVLRHNTRLSELSLRECKLNDAECLAEALEHNACLQKLDLSGNGMGPSSAQAIGKALERNKTLLVLDVSCNVFGDGGVSSVMDALRHNTTLRALHLSDNRIREGGEAAIGDALPHNGLLEELDLSNNEYIVGTRMAQGLNQSLKKLILHDNEINDEGAKAFRDALMALRALEELNLSDTHVSDKGATFLAEALEHTACSLSTLHIGGSHLTGAGFGRILKSLKHNTSLRTLHLGDTCFVFDDDDDKEACLEALEHNTTLQELCVCIDAEGPDGAFVAKARAIMERNQTIPSQLSSFVEDLPLGLWPHIMTKWPANILFTIFRENENRHVLLANDRR